MKSIMLVLRKLNPLGKDLHVVGENYEDQTSLLAVPPKLLETSHAPDFVNTEAIVARFLAINLAYPQIWDALSELFNYVEYGPEFDLLSASELGLVNHTTSFGVINHLLDKLYDGHAIAIGYLTGSKMSVNPAPGEKITWLENNRLVCVRRDKSPAMLQKDK